MRAYRLFWSLLVVLGGIAPLSAAKAQPIPTNELTLELAERVERLEAEVRNLRGQLEIQRYRIEQLQQQQQQRALPVPAPPASPGAAGQPEMVPPPASSVQSPRSPTLSVQPTPDPITTQSAEPTSVRSEQADFEAALGELREGRYDAAANRFQRFLAAYPNSALIGDAQYWLGESYYFSQDYGEAKQAFIDLGLHYPQSSRLPDALLKLGYIYGQQGDSERAREVFEKLVQVYPGTQAASLAERRLEMLR